MIYGYARVSTYGQVKGYSLEEQRAELQSNGCEEIIEEQYTGNTTARPKFEDLLNKLGKGIYPYSLRKLGDTERKNTAEIPARVSDYIMGHNGNPLDLRYVSDYYPLAKKAMPAWEKVMDGILGTETK